MGLSAFLNVNGIDLPTPLQGFNYEFATMVNNGRNANGAFVGQVVGREQIKLNSLKWSCLEPAEWMRILAAIRPFIVPVTLEDYRTGRPMTILMYPGNRKATPLFIDRSTKLVEKYRNCQFNLIDTGLE